MHMGIAERLNPRTILARRELVPESFVGVVTMMCPCENPRPITIPVIPGAGGGAQCQKCQTIWTVDRIRYEEPQMAPPAEGEPPVTGKVTIDVGFRAIKPAILQFKGDEPVF
jgi:hypothetical protein